MIQIIINRLCPAPSVRSSKRNLSERLCVRFSHVRKMFCPGTTAPPPDKTMRGMIKIRQLVVREDVRP